MKFFYSAGAMGYGEGYWFHRFYDFPDKLSLVTKTLTIKPRRGYKYAVLPFKGSVFNKIALDNVGFYWWYDNIYDFVDAYYDRDVIVSIAGLDDELEKMVDVLDYLSKIVGIELNFSCPNVKSFNNKNIPYSKHHKLYLKLSYKQDPYDYDLDKIEGIRLNSIPLRFCGGSGKIAQKKNWEFIEKFNKEGLNVAGCSFTSMEDIKRLEDLGCTEIGIGSAILTNPKLVEKLK
jgi:dihydroorotate dehydrogenase